MMFVLKMSMIVPFINCHKTLFFSDNLSAIYYVNLTFSFTTFS